MRAQTKEFPTQARYITDEMATWMQNGQTLGRLWNACRGRIKG